MVRAKHVNVDGMRLRYLEQGSGPPVVFLHGWMSGSGAWLSTLAVLSARYRCIALDLPGWGGSLPPAGFPFDVPTYAQVVAGFIKKLGLSPATLCGWSLGGSIALYMTATYPEYTARLVLVNAAGLRFRLSRFHSTLGHPLWGPVMMGLLSLNMTRLVRRVIQRNAVVDPQQAPRWFVDYHVQNARHPWVRRSALGVCRWARAASPEVMQQTVDKALRQVQAPTLILWGSEDRTFPVEDGRRAQSLISGSRLVVLRHSAHCPPVEEPGTFLKAMMDFLPRRRPLQLSLGTSGPQEQP